MMEGPLLGGGIKARHEGRNEISPTRSVGRSDASRRDDVHEGQEAEGMETQLRKWESKTKQTSVWDVFGH